MGWGFLGDLGGAMKDAAKTVGGDIVRGIKGAGKGIYKGVDKFDDAIKLKEIAQITQFIPGPHQPFASALAMTYAGTDAVKAGAEGNPLGFLMAGAQMYGSSKINTGGLPSGHLGPTQSFGDRVGRNIGDYTNQFGGRNALQNLMTGSQDPRMRRRSRPQQARPLQNNFSLSPTIGQQQGGRQNPMEIIKNPYTANQRLPQFAGGGIAGIPRLPDNFEGYVDRPHIVSLGERGTEVVVPLWKLMQQTRRY